ncbi:unnamed protein product [Parnassius mnemosyne]|uniref:Uncharacterized protein n=1 Tax=Parnassius mnemosyne TaxID=213953 RepID=A0AAV1KU22_9NEOP
MEVEEAICVYLGTPSSLNIRDKYANYFVNEGRVEWQDTKI